jgi:hypothetical protein
VTLAPRPLIPCKKKKDTLNVNYFAFLYVQHTTALSDLHLYQQLLSVGLKQRKNSLENTCVKHEIFLQVTNRAII